MQELSALQNEVSQWENLARNIDDTHDLIEMSLEEAPDEEMQADFVAEVAAMEKQLDEMEFLVNLSGKYDASDAVISISAGAGGTEAQDWVEMLLRMYLRWAEIRNFKTEILSQLEGDGAGLKSVTVLVRGRYAYGYLQSERGVHRLVRISPFDSANRRHTSFALVEVVPDIQDDIDIQINAEDLEMGVFRASGAGGQHMQKNSTAVRIKHLPTGIIVMCQNQRSQTQNKEAAMRVLKGRLYDLEQQRQQEEQARLKGEHIEAGWGNQIRSYVLHPYKMVKDHRTNFEVGNAEGVLDGKLDGFIEAYLKFNVGRDS